MANGGTKQEENHKAGYLKSIFLSKHSSESEHASVAGQTSLSHGGPEPFILYAIRSLSQESHQGCNAV